MRHRMKRRKLLTLLASFAVLLVALAPGCNTSPAGGGRKALLVYTPHGQDLLRDFIARYRQAHPDVDVQFQDMGSQQVLERLRLERHRPQADLWWGAAHTTFQTAADEGLLAPYRPTWADNVLAEERDAQDRWYATYRTPEVIVYNSEAVSRDEAPKDWDDVLDPKWRDKILIRNPNPSDTMRAIFGAMIFRFYKQTNSTEQGFDWLRRLDANVKEYTADGTLLMQKLGRREGLITLWNMPDAELYRQQRNFPVAYHVPASGTPVVTDGIAVVQGAPNAEEAKRFYEFVTSPDSLVHAAKTYYRIPARTDMDQSQLPAWMNEPFTRMQLDWDLLRREGSNWLRHWDAEIKGRSKK